MQQLTMAEEQRLDSVFRIDAQMALEIENGLAIAQGIRGSTAGGVPAYLIEGENTGTNQALAQRSLPGTIMRGATAKEPGRRAGERDTQWNVDCRIEQKRGNPGKEHQHGSRPVRSQRGSRHDRTEHTEQQQPFEC